MIFQRPSIRWKGLENTWKVHADRAAGRGLAWLRKKEAGAVRKNGRMRGLEKKELKTERGSVFYWIEKNAAPGAKCIVFTHGPVSYTHLDVYKRQESFPSLCKKYTFYAAAGNKKTCAVNPLRDFLSMIG